MSRAVSEGGNYRFGFLAQLAMEIERAKRRPNLDPFTHLSPADWAAILANEKLKNMFELELTLPLIELIKDMLGQENIVWPTSFNPHALVRLSVATLDRRHLLSPEKGLSAVCAWSIDLDLLAELEKRQQAAANTKDQTDQDFRASQIIPFGIQVVNEFNARSAPAQLKFINIIYDASRRRITFSVALSESSPPTDRATTIETSVNDRDDS